MEELPRNDDHAQKDNDHSRVAGQAREEPGFQGEKKQREDGTAADRSPYSAKQERGVDGYLVTGVARQRARLLPEAL